MSRIVAHRGLNRQFPENTLPAFRAALEYADGIELDVQLTRCGTPIVAHDDDLSRIYGVDKSLAEVDYADLRDLSPLEEYDTDERDLHPPSLAEALEIIPPDYWLNVEIKAPKVRRVTPTRAVADVLADLPHDPLFSSFNPLELARMAMYRTGARLGLLFDPASSYPLREALAAPVLDFANLEALHPSWKLISPDLLERAHDRGWTVNVWTVNDPDRASWLAREGVDALITDCPGVLAAALS